MNKTTLRKTSQTAFKELFLNNPNYFNADNKRHFNIKHSQCYKNDSDTIGILHEIQGKYLIEEGTRNVIKIAYKKNIITLTSDFQGTLKGLRVLETIKETLKYLGNREKEIINNLVKIEFNQDDNEIIFIQDLDKKSQNDSFSLFLKTGSIN